MIILLNENAQFFPLLKQDYNWPILILLGCHLKSETFQYYLNHTKFSGIKFLF